jgi:ubiquinone/menaquinone biosynthesis C-methylase UbiE
LVELLGPQSGRRYVDVACGTGNYTITLASAGVRITGFDAAAEMIDTARAKSALAAWPEWLLANVAETPFEAGAFAGAICTLAIHHFPDLTIAIREISRILDPVEGRFVIFTATPEQMDRYWLGRYFPEMMRRSAGQMPRIERVERALSSERFRKITLESYSVTPDLEDKFLYSGKHRPELYLDPDFRAGISSFANLADPAEIESGLSRLSRDIATGVFAEVTDSAPHDGGDYLFLLAER